MLTGTVPGRGPYVSGCNRRSDRTSCTDVDPGAAKSLLRKLRQFAEDVLDADERALLGALVAPAVARAFDLDEVEGFGMVGWSPDVLPETLTRALRDGWSVDQ